MVALGHLNVGLFANDEAMRDRVLEAAKAEGERMWPMPLEDDYKEYLKSAFADLANVGGRVGRRDHRRHVPEGIRRGHAVGAPGHRRHGLARGKQAVPGEGAFRELRCGRWCAWPRSGKIDKFGCGIKET